MKCGIVLMLSLLLLGGCESEKDFNNRQYLDIVSCDSGFTTGWVANASIWWKGIQWRRLDQLSSPFQERKMKEGEACISLSRQVKDINKTLTDYDSLLKL